MQLQGLCADFAAAMITVDHRHPVALNARTRQPYQPGIGPHTEAATVRLVMAELVLSKPDTYSGTAEDVPYADGTRQKCDLCFGNSPDWDWAIEVKMIRMLGDNGKPNDNLPTHILSPYPKHRSAVTDGPKLVNSGLQGHKAILMYGYEYDDWPLAPIVKAYEVQASQLVTLGPRITAPFDGLLHPVHQRGAVLAWEISA